jgi:NTP pyrophosphatase (non-canonical NTP hydrolase)
MKYKRRPRNFPIWPTDPLHAVAILNEEVGELNQAILQTIYEPEKSDKYDVRDEAIQAGAMVIRIHDES